MKKITLIYEEADGQPERMTGLHIDHGDGTATWIASGALDTARPAGSPYTWREIGERTRDDSAKLPKSRPPEAAKPASSIEDFTKVPK